MPLPIRRKEILPALLGIPLLCTLIVFGLISTAEPLFQDWENKTRDYRFKLRGNIPTSTKIALIDIDDRSIAQIGRWPWHRSIHARMIDILSESGAAVIGYDILFNQNASEAEDRVLQIAIKKADNLYLPTGFELVPDASVSPLLTVKREIGPIARLQDAAAGIGHISSNRDPDGTIRKVPLLVKNEDKDFPAFAISLLQGYFQSTENAQMHSDLKKIVLQTETNQNLHIPVNNQALMTINYAGSWVSTFSHYSFIDIQQAWQDPKNRQEMKEAFEGKILLVSNTATGYDLKPIPVESDYPGGGIHANVLNTIITGQYLQEPDTVFKFVISLFLAILISSLLFFKKGQTTLPLGLAIGLLYLIITSFVFSQGITLPVLFPILTITVTALSLLLYQKHLGTQTLRQLIQEKNTISKKFKTVEAALSNTQEKLNAKRNTLAQMIIETRQVTGEEKIHSDQIKRLQDGLEKSEREQCNLLQEKQILEEKVNQFSIAKINKGPSLQEPLESLRKEAARHGFITKNRALLEDFARIKKVAHSSLPILILGETGTGKERIAQIVHAMNTKTKKALVTVNTPAIPPTLFDSTLFGYVKGAFNDARSDRPGKFQEANNGTLFLDEIGEIPPELQVKLLRAIETGEIDRVGATQPDHVKVQIVSATNRPIQEAMRNNNFRSDLFFRLGGITIEIPPLRERKEDLEILTAYFLERNAVENRAKSKHLSKDALEKIKAHDWPGNVRELKNRIKKGFILAGDNPVISAADLELNQKSAAPSKPPGKTAIKSALPRVAVDISVDKDLSDTDFLILLKQHQFNKTRTAAAMDLKPLAVGSRFRGICLKALEEQGRDVKKAAKTLGSSDEDLSKIEKYITDYYQNLIQSVKHFADGAEAIEYCETKLFGNIKKKYRPSMKRLILHYFESTKERET